MKLATIDIAKLSVSKLNMRHGRTPPDVSDILPSIRARGVLVPLLVRPSGEGETFEIVAGRRRYFAVRAILENGGDIEPMPCAVIAPGDDAAALEASMIENFARLDPDEVSRWETFTRLIRREGRSVEDVSRTFGIADTYVRKVMALGNLLPRIRDLYRREQIDAATVRSLTLASKAQQKDWLALHDDPGQRAPTGDQLKAWLFGGQSIPTGAALFDLASFKGRIVTDLFGEGGYFADPDEFWTAQSEAVAALRDGYLEAGWAEVQVMEAGERFTSWEHEKTPKEQGGKVFIEIDHRGEVTAHEGWLTGAEARRARAAAAKAEGGEDAKPVRSETTSALQSYIDLHRHAAARAVLADHPGAALRLLIAHAIVGSDLWSVKAASQRSRDDAVTESVEVSAGETRFDEKRRAVLALLDRSPDDETVLLRGYLGEAALVAVYARLATLPDADVLAVAAIVMGESLSPGSAVVEAIGNHLAVDMGQLWSPDDALFDLIRDRQVTNALLRDVGGKRTADGNLTGKVKTQKAIIRDFLAGNGDREKVENWTPKWLTFPAARYTERPFATLDRWKSVAKLVKRLPPPASAPALLALPAPDPEAEPERLAA